MSKVTYIVRCEDGRTRAFHQSGIRSNHGYVFAGGHRVYGVKRAYLNGPEGFTAVGKHAWLVQPAPSAADLERV